MRSGHRYIILAAAVAMQACLGATYSWSIFVHFLREQAHLQQATAQLPFTVFYIAFPATMISSGLLLRRLGPRACAMVGGLIFGSGWMVASLGKLHFGLTILGIGLLGGIGVGLAYIVPIAVGMQWFPRNKGLVTGVAVAGFGGGAALVSHLAERFLRNSDASAFDVFFMFGAVFAGLVVLAGLLMRYPQPGALKGDNAADDLAWRDVVFSPTFRLLYLAMFVGLAAGFTINANLKQLCPNIDTRAGAIAVGIFAIANAAGRVSWGFAFDRLFSASAIRLNLLAQAALLLAAPLLIRSPRGLQVLAAIAGFNYGGVLVLYASAAAQKWGSQHVGRIYGWLFSANIPAALAPVVAAGIYDRTQAFTPALLTLAVVLIVAAAFRPPKNA